eukprot:8504752-Pyramimonas_sp.AAC.1
MGGNPDGRQPAGETRAERTLVAQAGAARPPPDSVARSPPGDPLGRGDTPRPSTHLPPCMRRQWERLLDTTAETLRTLGPPAQWSGL